MPWELLEIGGNLLRCLVYHDLGPFRLAAHLLVGILSLNDYTKAMTCV